jgi:DNA-binding transcriptional LysR family regulator
MEMLDLKLFSDLIELKSFTETAKKNHLTQSAVSQRIKRLNEYYDNKLFIDRKRLELSSHGKYVYEKFKDILNIYKSTEDLIGAKSAKEIMALGMSENAKIKHFGIDLINLILEKDFIPEIFLGISRTIYEKVLFGSLDYGIIGGFPGGSSELVINELNDERIVLATSIKNTCDVVKINEVPIVMDHRDSGLYHFLKNSLLGVGIVIDELNVAGYVGTSADKLRIMGEGDFWCFLPEGFVEKSPVLKGVELEFELRRMFYEIYLRKRGQKVVFVKEFIREHNKSIN